MSDQKRVALTDGSGRWFDVNKAECFGEEKRWDGRNHISVATGSQWEHQDLYRTASGVWIMNEWSDYQGSLETYRIIDESEAIAWLSANGHDDSIVADQIADLEI